LSWDEIRAATSDVQDGRNLVLHEFAHQLDREDGAVDGTPLLDQRSQYVAWARVLGAEYEKLKRDTWMGRPTVLDEYGTTDPAEFFAVATECFFEKPRVLEKRHPELYAELKSFYRQDPARLLPVNLSSSS
jgi:Mlc titration factor MtfA (ptsG expression regulator)